MLDVSQSGARSRLEIREQYEELSQGVANHGLAGGRERAFRLSPSPFPISAKLESELQFLGRVLVQFYRAANTLYRKSVAGEAPPWVHRYLDRGKPEYLIALQRAENFAHALPRVIRPDLLLTDDGITLVELDSVPGGIGVTAWLNETYTAFGNAVIGGAGGMLKGFGSIFGDARPITIAISEESSEYRAEMEWLCRRSLGRDGEVVPAEKPFTLEQGALYRFFELFDLPALPHCRAMLQRALKGEFLVTPPPKPLFEEKSLLTLLWNKHLEHYWHEALGASFFSTMKKIVPPGWILDPAPLPPQATLTHLGLTDWHGLKEVSKRDRDLILKISGFSPKAFGSRGVYLGSDLSKEEWAAAVDEALASFETNPYVLQRYCKPKGVRTMAFNDRGEVEPFEGRVRLCPYYFLAGESGLPALGGVLATICPKDKKFIHGMSAAILAPCSVAPQEERPH